MRRLIAAVLLLAATSALSLVVIPRFEVLEAAAIADPSFATLSAPDGQSVWLPVGGGRIEPVPNGVRIVNDDHGTVAGLDQVIKMPPDVRAYRVAATITLEDVEAGTETSQMPRVLVQAVPPGGSYYLHGEQQLIDQTGDSGPQRQSAIFWVDPAHGEARLLVRLQRATGAMTIQDLQVEALAKGPERIWLRRVLILVWLGVAAGIAFLLWRQSEDRLAAALVLAGMALMGGVMILPDDLRQPLHNLLHDLAGDARLAIVKPLLHLMGFATLALLSRLAMPNLPRALFVLAWLAAASVLELAELWFRLFDPGDFVDMAVNATGAMVGLALAGRRLSARRGHPVAAP